MRKIISVLLIITVLVFTVFAFAASTVTQTTSRLSSNVEMLTMAITADASGTVDVFQTTAFNGYIFMVTTDPGTPAPTNNYDIVFRDLHDGSLDIMGDALLNRNTASSEQVIPSIGSQAIELGRYVDGGASVAITGNTASNAELTIHIYYHKN